MVLCSELEQSCLAQTRMVAKHVAHAWPLRWRHKPEVRLSQSQASLKFSDREPYIPKILGSAGVCLTLAGLPPGRDGELPPLKLYGPWVRP